jgi:deazaflavin-dependent oxidoreductase (nitroreductase family)
VSTGIPRWDPSAPRARHFASLEAFARTRVGRRFGIDFAARVDPWLLRVSRGRIGTFLGTPMAALTTTGAKSGELRTAAVLYFSDGEDVILIASNFGQERHPAWYHNLKAHPGAVMERQGVTASYTAVEVYDDSERARLFELADLLYKGYADYRIRTAAIGRRIPILRLTLTR